MVPDGHSDFASLCFRRDAIVAHSIDMPEFEGPVFARGRLGSAVQLPPRPPQVPFERFYVFLDRCRLAGGLDPGCHHTAWERGAFQGLDATAEGESMVRGNLAGRGRGIDTASFEPWISGSGLGCNVRWIGLGDRRVTRWVNQQHENHAHATHHKHPR